MKRLNQFTGRSDKSLRKELVKLGKDWDAVRAGEGGGGSPGEGLLEHIHDVEAELKAREAQHEQAGDGTGDRQS